MTDALKNYGPQEALNPVLHIRQNAKEFGVTSEDLKLPISTVITLPKGAASTPTLVRTSKRYIVPYNGKFYSYPLMLIEHPTSQDLWKMQAPIPHILREGMVVVDGEVYFVKLEDLKRGIVRKSRQLPIPPKRTITYKDFLDGLACTPAADLPEDHYYSNASVARRRAALDSAEASTTGDAQEAGAYQGHITRATEILADLDEESRLIDLAFKEQVGALYGDSFEEGEWENANDSQS